VILAGLAFVILKFRDRQKQGLAEIPRPAPTASIDTTQIVPPQNPATVVTREVLTPEGMVLVPAGSYIMGRDDGDDQYHLAVPKHTVTLTAFYIDKTEVTNSEYKRFVDATGHVSPDAWRGVDFPDGKGNYPVIGVRWQDAVDYAVWAGKRLPSEAEWEAAARGSDGRLFPWGDRWQNGVANVGTTGIVQVGAFPAGASPNGALDMIGNVWEWTADELKLYPGNPGKMPESVEPGIVYRVIRGGAYDSKQDASYRGFVDASKAYPKTGFRCVNNAE
jgi:formylglycine-generating enzyme required for sulfatase activity